MTFFRRKGNGQVECKTGKTTGTYEVTQPAQGRVKAFLTLVGGKGKKVLRVSGGVLKKLFS